MFVRILRILLFLLIFSLPLGQFGRVPGLDPTIGVYVSDLLLGVFCLAAAIYLVGKRREIREIGERRGILTITLVAVFCLWAVACLAFGGSVLSNTELLISFSYWVRLLLFVVFFAEIYLLKKVAPEVVKSLPIWLVLSGVLLAVTGFVQLVIFPDFGLLDKALGWDPHLYRLNSTFFDPNFTGAYLVLCLGLLFVWKTEDGIQKTDSRKQKTDNRLKIVICYLLFVILTAAVFLTFSRSAWLMLAIVVFIYGLFRSRLLLLFALLLAFGAYFAVPRVQTRLSGITDPADSAQFRIASWQEGLQLSSKNLLTGVGFNALRYAKDSSEFYDYRPGLSTHSGAGFDSSLLVVLATTGVLGLVLFVAFYGVSLVGMLRRTADLDPSLGVQDDVNRRLLIAAVLVALLVESNFINSLFYAPITVVWASILGLFVD